ncbi:MAG: nucleotidyltransferase domain-containing protein [Candidatus Aenigmarchaeota archaeon]|nr:nucleotidyltransferase domain-containing protein [Candidatus Aenigmarchaeota archaeon]
MFLKRNRELEILTFYLGDYANRFYLREISKRAGMPLKTTRTVTTSLEKSGVLKSNVVGKNKFFKLNMNNTQTKFYLLQAEVHKTISFLEKYPVFKTFLKDVKTDDALIVFGGFAKFATDEDSDLDLLIISKEKTTYPFYLIPYKVQKIELSERAFFKALEGQETLIKEIEENHIVLNGHSFYANAMWGYYGTQ